MVLASLTGGKWYVPVVLICISQMNEHFKRLHFLFYEFPINILGPLKEVRFINVFAH